MNALEGVAERETRRTDLATMGAWQTAFFVLGMYSGSLKGKTLDDFLSRKSKPDPKSQTAKAIHFFHGLQARGFDVTITRH